MLKKGVKIGDYTLLKLVGSGGFADVWKAEKRTALDVNYFALKFFRPKDDGVDFEKVDKEINVWKQLKGLPHIISVTELDKFEDYVYVVSDFAEEGSLENFLKANDRKALPVERAVQIMLEILTGLENLHEKGFIHRDLKPDNIVIMNGKHCLTDFGISRKMKSLSKATGTAGTFEYMPPEAFDKKPSISAETDIWAVGIILQQLLTGKLPYPQEDQPSLIAAILMSEPEFLPNSIPGNLRKIVKKALQKKRGDRFRTAGEMKKALENVSQNSVAEQKSFTATANTFDSQKKYLSIQENIKDSEIEKLNNSLKQIPQITNHRPSHERLAELCSDDEDIKKALKVYQSLDVNTDPKLNDAIKEMQEKGILEMKEYMAKINKQTNNEQVGMV